MRSPLAVIILVSSLGTGCFGDKSPVEARRSPSPPGHVSSQASPGAAPAIPQVMEPPLTNRAPPSRAGAADTVAGISDRNLRDALEAAMRITGDDACETAFEGISMMSEAALHADPRRSPQDAISLPERGPFVAVCRGLPEPAQRCLVLSHQREHPVECRAILQALSADQRRALLSVKLGL